MFKRLNSEFLIPGLQKSRESLCALLSSQRQDVHWRVFALMEDGVVEGDMVEANQALPTCGSNYRTGGE